MIDTVTHDYLHGADPTTFLARLQATRETYPHHSRTSGIGVLPPLLA
jgi:hypothetical protein